MKTPRTPDLCRSSIGGYVSQIAPPREVGKFKRMFCKFNQTSPPSDVASKQKVGLQAVASNQEADGYFCSRSHASGSGNTCRWFTLLNGFREEKILSQPIRDVQLVRHKGIELLGWRRSQRYRSAKATTYICLIGCNSLDRVEFDDCGRLRAYLGTGARLLQEVGERIPLSQEGRVGERADGHRVHAASPTEGPAPSNRRPRRGTGAPWSFAYADVDAVYKRSGTGEPAPGKELGANAGLRARHGWQRGSLEELLGGCPSSYVAKPGPIRWSYLSL